VDHKTSMFALAAGKNGLTDSSRLTLPDCQSGEIELHVSIRYMLVACSSGLNK
jgi:hypothetical protein